LPITENISKEEITLPMFPMMQEKDIEFIRTKILEYIKEN
jgi:dTDP-4-amino-4,6-dideoxygalactose transaminase